MNLFLFLLHVLKVLFIWRSVALFENNFIDDNISIYSYIFNSIYIIIYYAQYTAYFTQWRNSVILHKVYKNTLVQK